MSASRFVPYVDIVIDPTRQAKLRRQLSSPSTPTTPTKAHTSRYVPYVDIVIDPTRQAELRRQLSSPSTLSPNLSPRKRRKLDRNATEHEISSKLARATLERQRLSPTASDYMFSPDSAVGPQTTEDEQEVEEDEEDSESRRSPSLGDVSNARPSSKGKIVNETERAFHYTIEIDEIIENDELQIPGETLPDDEDDSSSHVPVRVLSDFTLYNAKTMEVLLLAELLNLKYSREKYGASGLVKPWVDSDADDNVQDDLDDELEREENSTSDEGSDRVSLSEILEFSIHNISEDDQSLDPKIYIRTKFAWYILGCPSKKYRPYFTQFWVPHRLLYLLVTECTANSHITYPQFIKNLPSLDQSEDSIATAEIILGRELTEDDLKSDNSMAYIVSVLPDICIENGIKISQVPAVCKIMGGAYYDFDTNIPRMKKKMTLSMSRKFSNKEKEVLRHRNRTFLTEVVNQMAKNLFEVSLEVAESQKDQDDDDSDRTYINLLKYKAHHSNPLKIAWAGKPIKPGGVYHSVNVDGMVYNVGDVVMVEPGTKSEPVQVLRASQTVNKYGNRWWFCQICYFYEKAGTKMFHGLWFTHGSKTILQETSHSKALYLLEDCDDNPVTSIFKKCNFRITAPLEAEVEDDGSHDSNDFFCSHLYDEENVAFLDIPPDALNVGQAGSTSCFSCDCKDDLDRNSEITSKPNQITVHGFNYHVDDFVYIHPLSSPDATLLDIGQITKIQKLQVHITFLGRYDDYVDYQKNLDEGEPDLIYDERRLFFRKTTEVIPAHKIDGLCYVLHLTDEARIDRWIKQDDHYYLNQQGSVKALHSMEDEDFTYCKQCHKEDKEVGKQVERFLRTNSKLVGMELFCGAGGLGIGFDMSKFVESRYAIEFSPSAAKTYMANHPHTEVYCQDSSALLKHAITGKNDEGLEKALLSKIDDKTPCPPLPEKSDQIDFIFGGPPCQSFSRANHSKRRDDIRSTLACNMLSYVEHYEPKYFLLENVAGFLDHKFYTTRDTGAGKVESEIRSGMVKFVVRTLIALGYQVHYKLLQAGQYGVPQSRRRVIFWGAKRGVPLPQFPVPVYAFPTGVHRVTLPTGGMLLPPTRSKNPKDYHYFAPLRARTVNDAIGDLPPFDWENPHYIIPETSRDRREARKRLDELGIPAFNAIAKEGDGTFASLPGYPKGKRHPVPPQNRYQHWLRQGLEEGDVVMGQYTTRLTSKLIEATVNVPLRPLADHRDLPSNLLPNHAQPHSRKKNRTFYGRMDGDGYFKCAVTTLSPVLKNQWPVHPDQKRIITVREAARSQGFPDDYIFESCNKAPAQIVQDQLRQIGNAVAVPFALALGKELGKAMIQEWEIKQRDGSPQL